MTDRAFVVTMVVIPWELDQKLKEPANVFEVCDTIKDCIEHDIGTAHVWESRETVIGDYDDDHPLNLIELDDEGINYMRKLVEKTKIK